MRPRLLLALLLTVALLGAACGGDDDDSDTSADDTTEDTSDANDANEGDDAEAEDGDDSEGGSSSAIACDLVTEADVEEALPDADVNQAPGSTDNTCTYASEGLPLAIVTITMQRGALGGSANFEAVLEQLGGVLEGDVREVDGVGDAAVSLTVPVPILYVAVGDDLLAVSVVYGDDAEAGVEVEIELAKTAIERL